MIAVIARIAALAISVYRTPTASPDQLVRTARTFEEYLNP